MVYTITSNLQAICHLKLITEDIKESGGSMFNIVKEGPRAESSREVSDYRIEIT